jgi:8-oxo-dGTP diphosphatase
MIDRFNIRVYAVAIKEGKILALHEEYAGKQLMKFPGGGLEFGEGILECLHREFDEGLNLKINIVGHLYTQEDFLVSRFRNNEQLLNIYYRVEIEDLEEMLIRDPCIDKVEWIDLSQKENPMQLPIDQIVFDLLQKAEL